MVENKHKTINAIEDALEDLTNEQKVIKALCLALALLIQDKGYDEG